MQNGVSRTIRKRRNGILFVSEFFLKMATIKIDDVEYDSDNLSETAKAQVISLQFCQAEINRIKSQLAVYQTAAAGYTSALKSELDN